MLSQAGSPATARTQSTREPSCRSAEIDSRRVFDAGPRGRRNRFLGLAAGVARRAEPRRRREDGRAVGVAPLAPAVQPGGPERCQRCHHGCHCCRRAVVGQAGLPRGDSVLGPVHHPDQHLQEQGARRQPRPAWPVPQHRGAHRQAPPLLLCRLWARLTSSALSRPTNPHLVLPPLRRSRPSRPRPCRSSASSARRPRARRATSS